MPDPFKIFREAGSGRQESLRLVWQELYDCLARTGQSAEPRAVKCALAPPDGHADHGEAIARISPNGTPACRACLATLRPARPGGYPLALTDPRKPKS